MQKYQPVRVEAPENWGRVIQVLGSGAYGTVHHTIKGHAVKSYIQAPVGEFPEPGDIREIAYLVSTVAKHVISIQGVWIQDSKLWIQMPAADECLDSIVSKLSVDEMKDLLFQICVGVHELHSRGLVHLDLKLSNIAVQDGEVKILDLGLSRNQVSVEGAVNDASPFSLPYTPPEDFLDLPLDFSSDIWSLGVIFIEVLSRKKFSPFYPYESRSGSATREKVRDTLFSKTGLPSTQNWHEGTEALDRIQMKRRVFDSVPLQQQLQDYPEIVSQMLQLNPTKRLNIVEILHHPWFESQRGSRVFLPIFGNWEYLLSYQESVPGSTSGQGSVSGRVNSEWFYPYRKYLDYPSYDLALHLAGKWPERWDIREFRAACLVVGALMFETSMESATRWALDTSCSEQQLQEEVEWILKETEFQLNITTPYTLLRYKLVHSNSRKFKREAMILLRVSQCAGLQYHFTSEQIAETLYALAREYRTGALAKKLVDISILSSIRTNLRQYLQKSPYQGELLRSSPNLGDFL